MGLFDFLRRKNQSKETEKIAITEVPPHAAALKTQVIDAPPDPEINTNHYIDDRADGAEESFNFIFKYAEYVVRFLGMMFQGVTAPIAAYEKLDGELVGYLFIVGDDNYSLTAVQGVERMEAELNKRVDAGQIKSWVILYHSEFKKDDNHHVADNSADMHAITVKYKLNNTIEYLAIPYTMKGDEVIFKGFHGFSKRQNDAILSTKLEDGKDYFQEKIEIRAETYENEAGLQIKKTNSGSLSNMWGGILGFKKQAVSKSLLAQYMAATFMNDHLKNSTPEISVYEMSYGDVIFRGAKTADGSNRTIVPHVRATKSIDVVNEQINEWEHTKDLEAVISGGGRDTFGVTYFATDYAINKDIYHNQPKLDILFSAILFVLAESETDIQNEGQDITLSEGFTGYIPHKQLAEFGCFEFIGIVENFYRNDVLERGSAEGYVVKIKLINNDDIEDFFTIPMFINIENMRFTELRKGMKVSGVFQLLGEIEL
ncbi:hypothetical protein [Mucilaginibacter kameinonensis]|uniref:hypothetical protein n=1 Tax=Mucilaginibacter kameinonensis TaxID=452286 RepID=UPI000EF7B5E4|nr:hypothetical protein [Mucilaginibacter kameinonensis]